MTARMSVVIPAHDEAGGHRPAPRRARRRPAIAASSRSSSSRTDAPTRRSRSRAPTARRCSSSRSPQASKIAALEAGDRRPIAFPRAYVDADVVIDVPTLLALADALERAGGPLVASPRLDVDTCERLVARAGSITGSGSSPTTGGPGTSGRASTRSPPQGRRRFARWPQVIADDRFVQQLFLPDERLTLDEHAFTRAQRAHDRRAPAPVRRGSRAATSNCPTSSSAHPDAPRAIAPATSCDGWRSPTGALAVVRRLRDHLHAAEGSRAQAAHRRSKGAGMGTRRHQQGDRMTAPADATGSRTRPRGACS